MGKTTLAGTHCNSLPLAYYQDLPTSKVDVQGIAVASDERDE